MVNSYSVIRIKFEDDSYPDVAITDRKLKTVAQLNKYIIKIVEGITGYSAKIDDSGISGYKVRVIDQNYKTVAVVEWSSLFEHFVAKFSESPMFKAGYFCYEHNTANFNISESSEHALRFPSRKNAIDVLEAFGISEGYYTLEVIEV